MISIQNLEMIPPIHGKEKTFAWFPPSHDQYAKVPYKTMAVLDDFKYFYQQDETNKNIENIKEEKIEVEKGSSILSSKLNSIRQELTKKRVLPNYIRQQCFVKPNNIQEYMKIPLTWKPIYPQANIEIFTAEAPSKKVEAVTEANIKTNNSNQQCSKETSFESEQYAMKDKHLIKRPYTAPGHILKTDDYSRRSTASAGIRQNSSGTLTRTQRPSVSMQNRLRNVSASESNLTNLQYEGDMEKYKWLMEIPGDPFDIKGPHLPVKQQYFHPMTEVKILPQEPLMQKQNRDTFFYNSMPVETLSFDISPSFMSEKYNRMKNHLRSQGKWNYSSKNFSFVY